MKLERLEVRLRTNITSEMELIQALNAQDGNYGGKNELMRECLRRGFTALKQQMANLEKQGDEIAALDALAKAFATGDYGYRVVKTYLSSRDQNNLPHTVVDTPVAAPVPHTVVDTPVAAPVPHTVVDTPVASPVPRPPIDWSRMRGLAGSDGDDGQ